MLVHERTEAEKVYRQFIDLLNTRQYDRLTEVIDITRYRERCIGFTPGWIDFPKAVVSVARVFRAFDVFCEIDDLVIDGNRLYARATNRGRSIGWFYFLPPTGLRFKVTMFDCVSIADGKIVERVYLGDNLTQLGSMFWPVLALVLLVGGLIVAYGSVQFFH